MRLLISCLCLLTVLAGCSSKPPEPLTLEEIPSALRQAFEKARPELRKHSEDIVGLVEKHHYTGASLQISSLLSAQDLTEQQRSVASRALIAVNVAMQEQTAAITPETGQPSADPRQARPAADPEEAAAAAAVLEHHIRTK